jgi:hypothetical protein
MHDAGLMRGRQRRSGLDTNFKDFLQLDAFLVDLSA